jgi:hypothetical protein
MIDYRTWEDADAHSDVLTFKSSDNELVEIDRRRIIRVEQFNDDPDRPTPWPGLKMTPITVTYKPTVWSVGEGDDPHPATADIYSDYVEFEMWSGHTIHEIDLKAA